MHSKEYEYQLIIQFFVRNKVLYLGENGSSAWKSNNIDVVCNQCCTLLSYDFKNINIPL